MGKSGRWRTSSSKSSRKGRRRSERGAASKAARARQRTGAPQEMTAPRESAEAVGGAALPGFPVVAVGASAGGLEAFKRFMGAMPTDSGIAFALIPHLDPSHESLMVELLAKHTRMPVHEAGQGMAMQPNHVYIIPPNSYLAFKNGLLELSRPSETRGRQTAIDFSLRSLAEDQKERAIGVILSGTGSHGTAGIRE